MKEIRDFVVYYERHRNASARSGTADAPWDLHDSVEDSIFDFLCVRIFLKRKKAEEGRESAKPTEKELLEAMKKWAGVGKAPSTSDYGRMDAELCDEGKLMLFDLP